MSNRKLYYFAVFVIAMIWYILLSFLIGERYSGEWAAYALAIYLSGFLEVGIEKYFYAKTYESENTISKSSTCLAAVVIPATIAVICCEAAYMTSTNDRCISAFCIIVAGTAVYRLIYRLIETLFKHIYFRR